MLIRVPTGLEDVSKYVELLSALYASGKWKLDELKKLVGFNFLRVFREVEKVTYEGCSVKKKSLFCHLSLKSIDLLLIVQKVTLHSY